MDPSHAGSRTAAARTEVDEVLHAVFDGVAELRDLTIDLHARAAAEDRRPSTDDLATLRPIVLAHLGRPPGIAGTGVIAAENVLVDQPRWLEWWRTPGGSAEPVPLAVDLDPQHIDSYEYTSAAWFVGPRRTGRRTVVGPYVDFAGTDEYILTFAEPIHCADGFFGVAAADVRASDFEQAMLSWLNTVGPRALLVNASGRVLASNCPDAIIGSLAPAGERSTDRLPGGAEWAECGGLPWSLVTS